MSNSSLDPLHLPQIHDSEDFLSLSPNQSNPPPKSDPETLSSSHALLDAEDNSPEDDDDDDEEGEEVDEGQEQETPTISAGMSPITDSHLSAPDVTIAAVPGDVNARRVGSKRKKGKWKGKGKGKVMNVKKQQAIEEKLQSLTTNLNPIPFLPRKNLDFAKHEGVLKRLGLWDFVQIDFDRNIRVDLIAQLVATYEAKLRASYVNGYRIRVNRADLARAIRLPGKKDKGLDVDLDGVAFSDESIGFVVELVSDWVLLHEDMWMMPNEVMEWLKTIKDGHPEKVDWAALFWFMVEKELKQGGKLKDCYYASHLQHLIKFQRKELFLSEEPAVEAVELDAEVKEEGEEEDEEEEAEEEANEEAKVDGLVDGPEQDNHIMVGPSTKLTLGQDGEKEEEIKDVNMMDAENCKVNDEEAEGEQEEQGQWLLDGRNDLGEHFMQPCVAENADGFGSFEMRKEEDDEEEREEEEEEEAGDEDEEEPGNNFDVFSNDHALEGDGFTGNLLQAMEANHMTFNTEENLLSPSRADMQHIGSTHSFLNSTGKRVIEHDDNHVSHRPLNDSNKRLRISDSWENKSADLGTCLDQIQHWSERARIICEEKDQALEQAHMNQQVLLGEIQKRESMIEHLHKARMDEMQKKDREIYRLERELFLMETVLEGYRNALKETQKAFAEYRERAQLPEEPTYKHAGSGGLMLTAAEIEKLEKKREEEYKMNCLILEQKITEAEEIYRCHFNGYFEKINLLDQKLTGLEGNARKLIELHASHKIPQTEEKVLEVVETAPISQTEETMPEVVKTPPISETEEKAGEPLPIDQTEEKVPEVTEPCPIEQAEEVMTEVSEPCPIEQAEEVMTEVTEPCPIEQAEEAMTEVTEPCPIEQAEEVMTETEETLQKE